MTKALPMVATYMESFMNDRSAPDTKSIYWVLTLTALVYIESLLNDENASNGCCLYGVTSE